MRVERQFSGILTVKMYTSNLEIREKPLGGYREFFSLSFGAALVRFGPKMKDYIELARRKTLKKGMKCTKSLNRVVLRHERC